MSEREYHAKTLENIVHRMRIKTPYTYTSHRFKMTVQPIKLVDVTPDMEEDIILLAQRSKMAPHLGEVMAKHKNSLYRLYRRLRRSIFGPLVNEPPATFGKLEN